MAAMASSPGIDEMLVVIPNTPQRQDSPVTRKVTPSLELSTPIKSFILSPHGAISAERTLLRLADSPLFAPSMHLFPSGEAVIDKRSPLKTTHAHPELPESSTPGIQIPPSRHLVLPFTLRQNPVFSENSELLFRLFPDTKMVSFNGYFLVFCLRTLPPKPWPTTIAGVQPYFTTDPDDEGPAPPTKRSSKSRIRVSAEINATNLPPVRIDSAFELVFAFFSESGISITEVQYWSNFFVIVLEDEDTDLAKVPRAIARCNCFYLFENEMGRGRFLARHIQDPTEDVVDDGQYDVLRPGVILSSGRDQTTNLEYRTTSGVLVQDSLGEKYMTIASHAFPHGDAVFHPSATGKEVAQVIMEVLNSGIAIAKLHHDVPFENETFGSPLDGATPTRLMQLVSANETQIGSSIYMNNPYTRPLVIVGPSPLSLVRALPSEMQSQRNTTFSLPTNFKLLLPTPTMTKMSPEIEQRIANDLGAYHDRIKPKIAELAREFDIPYHKLRGRV